MTLHGHIKNWLRDNHGLHTYQAKAVIAIAQADKELERFRKWWSLDTTAPAVVRNIESIQNRTALLCSAYKRHLVEPTLLP